MILLYCLSVPTHMKGQSIHTLRSNIWSMLPTHTGSRRIRAKKSGKKVHRERESQEMQLGLLAFSTIYHDCLFSPQGEELSLVLGFDLAQQYQERTPKAPHLLGGYSIVSVTSFMIPTLSILMKDNRSIIITFRAL